MKTRFSIVIPTHNRVTWLARAVNSALAQSYTNYEIVIVNDGSTDNTQQYLEQLQNPKIRHIHNQKPTGAAAARNAAIRIANGELITFLDDDDELYPDILADTAAVFDQAAVEHDGSLAMTFTNIERVKVNQEGKIISSKTSDWGDAHYGPNGGSHEHLLTIARLATSWGITIRKDVLLEIGLFDEELPVSEDRDLFIRLLASGYTAKGIDSIGVKFYDHAATRLTNNRRSAVKANADAKLIKNSQTFFNEHPKLHAEFLIRQAQDHHLGGNHSAATQALQTLLKIQPTNTKAWSRLLRYSMRNKLNQ